MHYTVGAQACRGSAGSAEEQCRQYRGGAVQGSVRVDCDMRDERGDTVRTAKNVFFFCNLFSVF